MIDTVQSTQSTVQKEQDIEEEDQGPIPFKRIKIYDLPWEVTRGHLEELASKFGKVALVELRKGRYGMIGFITFNTYIDADFALYRLRDGYVFMGSKIKVFPAPVTQEEIERKKKEKLEREKKNSEVGRKKTKVQKKSLRFLAPANQPTQKNQQTVGQNNNQSRQGQGQLRQGQNQGQSRQGQGQSQSRQGQNQGQSRQGQGQGQSRQGQGSQSYVQRNQNQSQGGQNNGQRRQNGKQGNKKKSIKIYC